VKASVFGQDVAALARSLIGREFSVDGVGGVIVETEAYDVDDAASHSFGGQSDRNAPMYGAPGHTYVYRIYGLHWCLNFVGGARPGGAVLIRALEPRTGLKQMCERRGLTDIGLLCSGPGRLCQALGISGAHNRLPLDREPFRLSGSAAPKVLTGPRIGISKEIDRPWRFGLAGSPFVSRKFQPPF
jgi:DNA-3-methyladenine glycosylase